ncbi:MAG TPA: S53 family peptidase [Polyangiaceae bacterium]|nr:S53 family peptidase [Polyangiaceae bacterium]
MSFYSKKALISFVALAAIGCIPLACSSSSRDSNDEDPDQAALAAIPNVPSKKLDCGTPAKPGYAVCHARVRTDSNGNIKAFATPGGLGPSQLASAYLIPSTGGAGKTIAIVDANDDPNAESDLATYRSTFGLPACTTANGCFQKVNQNGQQSNYPSPDAGWAGEIALDIDMASAACPACNILLVEANTASIADLGTSVNTAASLGATVISNSYGGGEDGSEATSDSQYYTHAGVAIFASTGDGAYGASYPATGKAVISVGGTALTTSTSARGWAEKVWFTNSTEGTGSGCSSHVAKPSYQTQTACSTKKATADLSAVADPATGVAVYDTYGGSGWAVYGGTSVSSPLVASIFAKIGQGAATGAYPWQNQANFYDVTTGSNGTCSPSILCKAGTGWDGPTGVGTPNATAIANGGTDAGPPADSGTGVDSGPVDSGHDSGTGTCSHAVCDQGDPLTKSCSTCATAVCKRDSYCCSTAWDDICVSEVSRYCGQTCN